MNNLKRLRKEAGLIQIELAKNVGVNALRYSRFEQGLSIRDGFYFGSLLAAYFGCKVSYIVNKDGLVSYDNSRSIEDRLIKGLEQHGSIVFSVNQIKEEVGRLGVKILEDYLDELSDVNNAVYQIKNDIVLFEVHKKDVMSIAKIQRIQKFLNPSEESDVFGSNSQVYFDKFLDLFVLCDNASMDNRTKGDSQTVITLICDWIIEEFRGCFYVGNNITEDIKRSVRDFIASSKVRSQRSLYNALKLFFIKSGVDCYKF